MDVNPDVVTGASIGALVAAIYSGGALDALEEWARKQTLRDFVGMLDIDLSSGGLVEGAEILDVIRRLLDVDRIERLPIPLAIVATDMSTGREVWMTEGDVAQAVRASVALPGVISPYRIGDRWFLDGGLTNPLPVSACRILGAEVVIAANPNGRFDGTFWVEREEQMPVFWKSWGERMGDWGGAFSEMFKKAGEGEKEELAPHYLDVISASIDIMTDGIRRAKLAGDPPHVLLDAHLSSLSVLDFHKAAEAIDEGRRIVEENAEAIARCAKL